MATRYHFVSSYSLTSSREAVWKALLAVTDWPSWWKWERSVDVIAKPASDDGVGAIYRNVVTTPSRYGFTYDTGIAAVVPLRRIDVTSTGDIEGTGRFVLAEGASGGTELTFLWLVQTPKWWMNLMAPLARRGFAWNHNRLMTDFGTGLAGVTGGQLTRVEHEMLGPGDPGFWVMPPEEG